MSLLIKKFRSIEMTWDGDESANHAELLTEVGLYQATAGVEAELREGPMTAIVRTAKGTNRVITGRWKVEEW